MDGRSSMLLLLMVVLVLMSASLTMADLCKTCKCDVEGSIYRVKCRCLSDSKQILDFTQEFVQEHRDNVQIISVYQCHEVVFRKGSFNGLTQLVLLSVEEASRLRIEADSLSSMNTFELYLVDRLELEPRALYGITIKELRMRTVGVGKLESDTLDLNELQLFQLIRSNFTKVESRAISVAMASNSQFFVGECHFGTVGSKGVLVTSASKATVVRTTFESLEDNGFTVRAMDSAVVDHNRFGSDVSSHGLCISAAKVNITSNSFRKLPGCVNSGSFTPTQSLLFKNNTVMQGSLNVSNIIGSFHYKDNSFQCKCRNVSGKQQENVPDGIVKKLLEENFCYSIKCPMSVSLAKFQRHLLDDKCAATCDDEKLCELQNNNSVTCNNVEQLNSTQSESSVAHVLPLVATLITVQLVAVLVI